MSDENITKDLDYYLNLDWTLVEGTDTDFNGNPYYYVEIKEIPSFTYCAKTREKALENYKNQLKLSLMLMLEDGEEIVEPNNEGRYNGFSYELDAEDDDTDWESICP
ncbi:MAG: hypothetical protein MJ231_04230 [bacterium]|nr:hypothetical protein [bacterium]